MADARPGRLYHLDALRCFCMLYGLMVHGATIGNNLFFEFVKDSSDLFRMSAFFLVSGYFSAMVLARSSVPAFLHNRGRLILVPFFAGLLLLNPITIFLVQRFHGGVGWSAWWGGAWRLPAPGPAIWHLHLWFLISLAVYALLTPLLLALGRSQLVTRPLRWVSAQHGLVAPLLLSLLVAVSVVVLRGFHDQLVGPFVPPAAQFIVQVTFGYLPYFAIGVFAFALPSLFNALHRPFWPGLLLFGAALYFHPYFADALPHGLERASFWLARGGLIYSIVSCMLWVMQKIFTKGSPFLAMLTDCVYSFYIFHYLLIYIVANLMHLLTGNVVVIYVAILLTGYPILFWLHRHVIAPSPLLRFLFNGKPLVRRKPASA